MICPSKILQELIEVFATRGYTRIEARKRAERILQRATV
jgi:hypothetical protein